MDEEVKCPHCGSTENFHFNYDYHKKDYWNHVIEVLCNECGKFFKLKDDGVQNKENT